jgi:hypothetical protein
MFFSGQYSKNKKANEINATSDDSSDSKTDDKTSLSLTSNTSNHEISTAKIEELPITVSTSVNNKRKIEEDEVGEEKIDASKKLKNEDVNVCKRERWQVVSEEVEVDLFCVQGWRDELCCCDKVCITKKNRCFIIRL